MHEITAFTYFQHPRWTALPDLQYIKHPSTMGRGHHFLTHVLLTSTGQNFDLVSPHRPKFKFLKN